MKIAFYGSSLLSTYWNGAATYYRGILSSLAALGHEITFYEPDAYDRGRHRDMEPPSWARVCVYDACADAAMAASAQAAAADVVVKASGVGVFDDLLLDRVMAAAAERAIVLFWDVDAPATLAEIQQSAAHPLRRALPALDGVLTYGGGQPVIDAYRRLGARDCVPIYNAVDPATHYPAPPQPRFTGDLGFLGNRLPDREHRVIDFLLNPARRLPHRRFVLGGAGWDAGTLPGNVRHVGHVPSFEHNAFNASTGAVLNIARDSMAVTGYSPATRVFEAAGAGACLITDAWAGIELFLTPEEEILVARDGQDVAALLETLTPARARTIGASARRRVLNEHTYAQRAATVDALLKKKVARKAGL